MRRAYYSQKEIQRTRVNVARIVEAESEISSRSHKPAPDCRNSEWDYADCVGHNRVAIGLRPRGAMGDAAPKFERFDFETCERTKRPASRNSHNRRMGLNTGGSRREKERGDMGFPMDEGAARISQRFLLRLICTRP